MKEISKPKKPEKRRRRASNDTIADWGSAEPKLLASVISAVASDGGAIRLGYSRDGGAYAVGIYGDGKPFTEYLPGTQDVDEWLEGFKSDFE